MKRDFSCKKLEDILMFCYVRLFLDRGKEVFEFIDEFIAISPEAICGVQSIMAPAS
jgi:hypothetical protein